MVFKIKNDLFGYEDSDTLLQIRDKQNAIEMMFFQ